MLKMVTNKVVRTSAIGLDLGDSAIRVAQVQYRRGIIEIIGVAGTDLPSGEGHDSKNMVDPLLLKHALSSVGFRGKKVVFGLCSPEVEFHALDIAAQNGDAMQQAITDETLRLTNNVNEQMELNYWMLPDTLVPVPNIMSVATPTTYIEQVLHACEQAGYTCHRVDVAPTALGRFVDVLKAWPSSSVWGVLDIGQRQSRLVVYVDHVPVLVRSVGAGVKAWVSTVATALGVSENTARIQLFDHGVALSNRGTSSTGESNDSELSSIIGSYLRRDLHDLTSEVGRSYEYILSSFPKREAGDLVLVGCGACVRGVSEFLAQGLGIEARLASAYLNTPGCRLQFRSANNLPLEMIGLAVGLAIEDEQ